MADLTLVRPGPRTALERLVEDYLMACRARGLSKNTIELSYGYPLRAVFLPWCAEQGMTDISQLDRRAADSFSVALREMRSRRGAPLSVTTVHAYLRSIRGFLTWCEREGEGSPVRPPLPRLPRRVVHVLDREEVRRLVAAAPTERDRLILGILADCGVRNQEVCALRTDDVVRHDRQSFLRIHGKGSRDRLVPLPPALLRGIERYQRHGRPADTRSDRLFVSLRRGLSGEYEPLTRSGVLKLVRSAAERAGIAKDVYPHLLRHSFITNALRGGMDSMVVAQIVGHTSLRMIERVYSHLNAGDAYHALLVLLSQDSDR
ncbi:MAG TPA: tyrosine-type recombinase/integrase [Solirubrobacteraceae bacterium]|nr:tyrosine-type recombinase/integrase [Solirubrobacteraceae bacterium]